MQFFWRVALPAALLSAVSFAPAWADDWKISRLDGDAFVLFQGRWTPLKLGDIVSDDSFVRTLATGALQFTRDHEMIELQPNTEIQILDRTGKRYTTIRQYFGTVGVEANREQVQHFEVRTPFLAAVVKGTVFGVSTQGKLSAVAVTRGKVGVHGALGPSADVTPGMTATVTKGLQGVSIGHSAPGAASASSAASAASAAASSAASSSAASSSGSSSGGGAASAGGAPAASTAASAAAPASSSPSASGATSATASNAAATAAASDASSPAKSNANTSTPNNGSAPNGRSANFGPACNHGGLGHGGGPGGGR